MKTTRAKNRMLSAVAVSIAAAVATMLRVSTLDAVFGPEQYLIQAFPYLLMIALAIACRRTVQGASISLISALAIGGFGVFLIYTAGREIDTVAGTPFILVAGFLVALLVQLVRMAFKIK